MIEQRIKLAEAMGYTVGTMGNGMAKVGPNGIIDKTTMRRLHDPFTDANDDVACLEYMRSNREVYGQILQELDCEQALSDYHVGTFAEAMLDDLNARAALEVIDG